MELEYNKWYV